MGTKVLLVSGTTHDANSYNSPSVKAVFDEWVKKYDLDFEIVEDNGLQCDGGEQGEQILRLERSGPNWIRHSEEYLKKVEEAEILIVGFAGVGKQLLEHAKNLKLIAVMRSGVENVDIEAAKEKGIIVCNAPGRLQETVSDMSCAMILDLNRAITYMNVESKLRDGESVMPYFHPELFKDITLGIFGFGIIGQVVCKKLAGFGMKYLAYDPFVTQEQADKLGLGVKMVDAETLFKESDTISVHARYLQGVNDKVISKELIDSMKPTAFFVNTARAGLEDEEALIDALREHRICGAALDVTYEEPVPADHPLRALDNCILTPHVAGMAGDGQKISAEIITNQISMYLDGGMPTSAK